ncbi:MAG: hypothetical protein GF398_07015 [Chitinivibrionales bacterium]|nr:hypothetical protein [Chitinivibrionales bacterium]
MKRFTLSTMTLVVSAALFAGAFAEDEKKADTEKKTDDTLVVIARVTEIPGTFPPNDLYNYVYIMKYRVMKVEKGEFDGKEILVGHYNPLIPRKQIKDKMDKYVNGNVEKFEEGAKHKLVLVKPIDKVWQEALEDEYFDDESDKYYCLKADVAK